MKCTILSGFMREIYEKSNENNVKYEFCIQPALDDSLQTEFDTNMANSTHVKILTCFDIHLTHLSKTCSLEYLMEFENNSRFLLF